MKNLFNMIILLMIIQPIYSQKNVSGSVSDNNGIPLGGATIQIVGTSTGVTSDMEGIFTINVTEGQTLKFDYIGFESQLIVVDASNMVNVILDPGIELQEILLVGSRNYNRSVLESPVPVDVVDISELSITTGRSTFNDLFQYSVPSFNATKQSGSDGADHIDPASLRGLGPDQTLVLINGKRRHQSSLVNVFGTKGRGNSGTDLNAIPTSAIKRVEVLRDGASAQYGSDAIAGVINIVLKDDTDGLSAGLTYGAYSTDVGGDYAQKFFDTQDGWEPDLFSIEGKNRIDGKDKSYDGNTVKFDLNYGTSIGENGGFINITTELLTKDRTLRPSFDWRKGYGTAAIDQFQFMINSSIPLTEKSNLYLFGGKSDRYSDAYAFTRGAPGADGDSRSVKSLYPNGFSPRITSKIIDNDITVGVLSELSNGWIADFSNTYGSNNFHYYIKGSNNASLGDASPTDFDAGGHSLEMNVTSLDFSKYFENVASGLNIAFGTEFRSEIFEIFAGEESSYAIYDLNGLAISNPELQNPFVDQYGNQPSGGSQGFPGYSPQNEVNRSRTNIGFYGDFELNASDSFLISAALRYEDYSDFGNTLNFKLASRLKLNDNLAIRSSISNGFRAPSLTQIHYNLIFNNIIAGRSERTLLAANTSTVAKSFGIDSLNEEVANNFSAGFTYNSGGFSATVDAYSISVDDRIILTDIFDATTLNVGADAAQFFANGVDTKTTGIDIVLNYTQQLSNGASIGAGISGNINDTEIESINSGNLDEQTFFGPFSQAYLETAAPDSKFAFNINYIREKLNFNITWTQFSEVILQDFQWVDDPSTASISSATDVYEAVGSLDFSLKYDLSTGIDLIIGGTNILNTYPTPQFDGWTDQGGLSDAVQIGSDGAYFFTSIRLDL